MQENDLIYRAEAIKAITPLKYKGDFISALIHLPAIDAVPVVHASWIVHKSPSGRFTALLECGNCHHKSIVMLFPLYCQFCGAIMDGGDDRATD